MEDEKTFLYLNTLLTKGSFSSAAQALFMSQPSLSQYISRLETTVGSKIIDRNSKPLKLTITGKIYYDSLIEIINIKERTFENISDLDNLNKGKITIGALSYISQAVLSQVIVTYRKIYPKITVNIIDGSLLELEEYAAEGIVDFSILMFPYENCKLDYVELGDEPIVVAASKNSNIVKMLEIKYPQGLLYPLVDLSELKDENFIILTREKRLRRSYEEVMEIIDSAPKRNIETNDVMNSLILTSCDEGVSLVPLSLARQFKDIFPVVFFNPIQRISKRKIIAAYNKTYQSSKASIEFIKILKDFYEFNKLDKFN